MEEIKLDNLSSTQLGVSFYVPPNKVDQKFTEFFSSIKNKAEVPGFRKGRAPVEQIKKLYTEKAKPTISQSLVAEYWARLLKEHNVSPVGNPIIKDFNSNDSFVGKFNLDGSFVVELVIDVLPKIDPVGYRGLDLKVPDLKVDEFYNTKIMKYREQFAERTSVTDRGAQFGDMLVVDFIGYLNGAKFDGGSATGHTIDKLGQGSLIPGFESQVVGMKVGEVKDIKVKFPDSYKAKHLEGKEVVFNIKVHNIIATKLAEIDNDLAMMAGFNGLLEFEVKMREEAEKDCKAKVRQILDQKITDELLKANQFDVPNSMIEEEQKRLRKMIKVDQLPEEAMTALKQRAEINVKRALVLDAIYDNEKELELTAIEVDGLLEEHSKLQNMSKDQLTSALYNSKQMDGFLSILKVSKVIDLIIQNFKKDS